MLVVVLAWVLVVDPLGLDPGPTLVVVVVGLDPAWVLAVVPLGLDPGPTLVEVVVGLDPGWVPAVDVVEVAPGVGLGEVAVELEEVEVDTGGAPEDEAVEPLLPVTTVVVAGAGIVLQFSSSHVLQSIDSLFTQLTLLQKSVCLMAQSCVTTNTMLPVRGLR